MNVCCWPVAQRNWMATPMRHAEHASWMHVFSSFSLLNALQFPFGCRKCIGFSNNFFRCHVAPTHPHEEQSTGKLFENCNAFEKHSVIIIFNNRIRIKISLLLAGLWMRIWWHSLAFERQCCDKCHRDHFAATRNELQSHDLCAVSNHGCANHSPGHGQTQAPAWHPAYEAASDTSQQRADPLLEIWPA